MVPAEVVFLVSPCADNALDIADRIHNDHRTLRLFAVLADIGEVVVVLKHFLHRALYPGIHRRIDTQAAGGQQCLCQLL